jgi:chorismate mutase
MKIPILFRTGIFALLAAGLVGGFPVRATAAGAGEGAAAKRPVPDTEKKVITNDDLEAKYGKPTPASEIKNSQAISAAAQTTAAAQPARSASRREPLPREKDPAWYARQVVSLNDEIANIDNEAQPLIGFRSPGNTPSAGTGLILNAPCDGITTDNRIAQLLARRQEIESQVAALQDTAQRNDMPPGLFDQAAEIAQASEQRPALTPARERATLADQLGQLSNELAETQSVVEGMQEDTAARRMTLLPPTGNGANMTTDLLARLGAQSNALQSQIGSVEDDALRAGLPARDLP